MRADMDQRLNESLVVHVFLIFQIRVNPRSSAAKISSANTHCFQREQERDDYH